MYFFFLIKKMGGSICCRLATALLYAGDKQILVFHLDGVWFFWGGGWWWCPFLWFLALVASFSVHLASN